MNYPIPLYALFSILALVVKAFIWANNPHLFSKSNKWFVAFFVSLFGINTLELLGFFYFDSDYIGVVLMSIYYMCLIVMSGSMLGMTLDVTGKAKQLYAILILSSTIFGIFTLAMPGIVISGVKNIGYSATRIEGPFYWVFQLQFLSCIVASVSVLVSSSISGKDILIKRRAKALLISISPIFIAALVVILLLEFDLNINGSVIGSMAILIFLLTFVIIEHDQKLFQFLSFVPATSEYKLVSKLRSAISKGELGDLSGAVNRFENILINEVMNSCNGNKTVAAETLGISRSTLRRKLSEA